MTNNLSTVKALTFDVFGTVVDWRSSVIRECTELGKREGIIADWASFADKWRGGYAPAMDQVRKGELSWKSIDELHRMVLERLLEEFNITELTEDEKVHLNKAWHRLTPWADSVEGLLRLKEKYIVATLSNGNISLLVNMAKYSGLPWDCILSSELAKHYKPDKEVYLTAASLLDLDPEQIMMCAAHRDDLEAASALGFKTAYISRPLEFGPEGKTDEIEDMPFDIIAQDILDLAQKLGV
ncbi:MAG: haloacid dehalogenase type II [Candidatus Dadabacteria bacterium]|nr:haloacid dehalogenase type II [Candidatus Dadabacteria bacterium]